MKFAEVRAVRPVESTVERVRDAVLALHRQQHAASLIFPGASEKSASQARALLRAIGPRLEQLRPEIAGVVYLAGLRCIRVTEITPDDAISSGQFTFGDGAPC